MNGVFVLPVLFAMLLPALQQNNTSENSNPVFNSSIQQDTPADLHAVFKNVCMDCHASGGKALAMAKLNFSKWNEYSSEEKAKKASKICNELSEGTMPPKSYRKAHPASKPTQEQIDEICKWSENL